MAIVAVAAFPSSEAIRILVQRPHVVMYGDQALLELGVRRAIHLDQLVGPYSRDGFHHLGPAVFYLLAPFVQILEPSGPGLYLGAVASNAAALVATVAVVWRRLGPLAALWAAAAIDLFCLCVGVGTLREPWNPYLVVAPMVLFVVLWAAGITGSRGAAVWSVVIGSYEVQTHIATATLVAAMVAILIVYRAVLWRGRRQRRSGVRLAGVPAPVLSPPVPSARTPAVASGIVVLALIWLAPVVELPRDRPNNAQLVWDFFRSPPGTPPLHQALGISADALTIMPFGNHDYVQALHRSPIEIAIAAFLMVAGLVAAATLGRRHHQPMSLALAASAVLGVVVGTVSVTHTFGPAYLYFVVWLAYVPLSLVLAIGAALLGSTGPQLSVAPMAVAARRDRYRPPRRFSPVRRSVLAACVVAAVAAAATTVASDLETGPVNTTTGSGPWPPGLGATVSGKERTIQATSALSRAAESVLRPNDRWVGFTIDSGSLWPYVAGIVLELDERGVQSTVGPAAWELYFGHERAPGRPVQVAFDVYPSSDTSARDGSHGTVIADLDGAVLTYRRIGI